MAAVRLSFACGLYDRMLPLYTREVRPEGIDLEFIVIDTPREIFDRMAAGEFDVAEMSSSEFMIHRSAGKCPFVAIPVFPSRVFRHGYITVNRRSGIRGPKDLEGKRIGVPLYTMTAAIWIRGHLQHDFGVDLSRIRWIQGSIDHPGRFGKPSVLPLFAPLPVENNDSGKSLSQLIDEGEIDAIIGTNFPAAMRHNPDIGRLFPNYREVEKDFYLRTRIFPIMHLVAIRREVHEKHPFVAQSLYQAFCVAKNRALAKMRTADTLRYMLPWMHAEQEAMNEIFGDDPWPYGVEPNRPTLEALIEYMVEQALLPAVVRAEDLFVPIDEAEE